MADKRYYWLKLKDDFFTSKRIKKMRKLAGGDTYTIIYLKMQLVAIKHDGKLEYSGIEPTIAEEIALDIDESVDDVKLCLSYLIGCGLAEECGDGCFFPYAVENTGSEGSAAERMRIARARAKQRQIEEHSCNNVTQSSNGVKQIGTSFELSYGEKEKEIEIEKEKKESKRFTPPSREEVQAYCEERKNNVDADSFVDFYSSKGWMVGKNPMKDWKACVRTWERRDTGKRKEAVDRNKFNQFPQHEYDWDALESELLGG